MNHYIHHIPGTLRIKNPIFKNNVAILDKFSNCFLGSAGIEYVTTNPLTGSVIVNYNTAVIHPDRLVEILKNGEFFNGDQTPGLDRIIRF
jgi:hypothetical protein